jgi:hypothetical protein
MILLRKINSQTYYYLGGIVLLCLYYLPFFIFGENTNLIIHDNLDQNMYEFVALKRMYAPYYQNGQFIQYMNGLPDYMLTASKWNVTGLLFLLFHPFVAYLLNDFMSRIVGFLGMSLLLDGCVLSKDSKYRNIVIFPTAIMFSLLGCYTIYRGLTIMGQPLLMFAFWNLYKGNVRWWHYLIIVIFAFWSGLILGGIFIGILIASIWLFGVVKDKRFRLPFFAGMALLGFGYLITEHSMLFSMFDKSTITAHRVDFKSELIPFFSHIKDVARNGALITSYHTGQFWTVFILLPLIYLMFSKRITKFMWYLIGGINCILIIYFLNPYITFWIGEKIILVKAFMWNRFFWLLPMLWLVLFAATIECFLRNASILRLFLSAVLTLGLCFSVMSHNRELCWNMGRIVGIKPANPSFRDFYDTKLFADIKVYIGEGSTENYRVVSLGMLPSVASYNGFFALDAYLNLYPLSYKHLFREIITPELDKSIELKKYFDNWGSRCYLFSSELETNFLWSKKDDKKVFHLDIDTEKLKQLSQKTTYIISAVEIVNHKALDLMLEKVFEGEYWRIYLYRVNDNSISKK